MKSLSEIWHDDLFSRCGEAEELVAYIESLAERTNFRGDKESYVIAVDGKYGEGKTFFLKRLAEHLSLNHPVSYVDAWADDIADEPMTAVAATLQASLQGFLQDNQIRTKFERFLSASGEVLKITSAGLARRAAGLAFTSIAVEGIEELLNGGQASLDPKFAPDKVSLGEGLDSDLTRDLASLDAVKLMKNKINEFNLRKNAILEMRKSLAEIVNSLNNVDVFPPIILIIDELDRCRPNYAIKVLEEIKHLFDVKGVVFILGMYGDQLEKSISSTYGSNFNGKSYLHRFVDRKYFLRSPNIELLLELQIKQSTIVENKIEFPKIVDREGNPHPKLLSKILAMYMRLYGLKVRDSFKLVDILETSLVISERPLAGGYLIPLVIASLQGLERGALPQPAESADYEFRIFNQGGMREGESVGLHRYAEDFHHVASQPRDVIERMLNDPNPGFPIRAIGAIRGWGDVSPPLWDPTRFQDLIASVARFVRLEPTA